MNPPLQRSAAAGPLQVAPDEAQETLRAIVMGEVDAFVVRHGSDEQVLVLEGVERPYRLLIERMNQGAVTLRTDGTVLYCNRRLAELLERPPASLSGSPFLALVDPQDSAVAEAVLRAAAHGNVEREVRLRRPSGESVPASLSGSPLLEHNGVLCLIVSDLTEQKRLESQREALLREQAARAAAESAAAVLLEEDRRKDASLAILAHELRNPLATLGNGLALLNTIGSADPQVRKTGEMMARQLTSVVRLVDDLLDAARVTQGKVELNRTRTDLMVVARRASESCRLTIEERGHTLAVALSPDPLPAEVDPVRLTQVLINLLVNAAKFTPPGGTIRLEAGMASDPGFAEIRVRDDGIGLSPEMLPRLFHLFVQADPALSRSQGGLGIGLSLAKSLVELHGGTLTAASPGLGQGTEFTIRIPLLRDDAIRTDAVLPVSAGAAVSRSRILIIDDNRDAAESLVLLLRNQGHEVRHTPSGAEGLEFLAAFAPRLILLDIGLPGMDGFEVARALQAHPDRAAFRVIGLSGYPGEEFERHALEAGCDEYLVKPLDPDQLRARIAALPRE